MRSAIRLFACAVALLAALCAPAVAAPANGQLAAVVDGRLLAFNADGSGVRPLAAAEAPITELAFSPDGNRLALAQGGRIVVLEPATGRLMALTSGSADANPGWSADGTRIGFRRGLLAYTVPSAGGTPQPHSLALAPETSQIGWAPDLAGAAAVVAGRLALAQDEPVTGAPAYSPDGGRIAFANERGLLTIPAAGGVPALVVAAPALTPRWSPDSATIVYAAGAHLRAVDVAGGAPRNVLSGMSRVTAVDWQPCISGVTVTCASARPPQCSTTPVTVTTQADQPVDLPAPPCVDPADRPLTPVVVRAPERGTLAGWRYTPAAGFAGQDTMTFRVSNGIADSELVRLTIFVVPRPPAPAPAARPPAPAPRAAPFLTARQVPRLSRMRRALVRLSCDQDCALSVRLTARVRGRKRVLTGPLVRRSIPARGELTLRLRLPLRPRGAVKTVWITGRVRNAAGDARVVKLPVRRPR